MAGRRTALVAVIEVGIGLAAAGELISKKTAAILALLTIPLIAALAWPWIREVSRLRIVWTSDGPAAPPKAPGPPPGVLEVITQLTNTDTLIRVDGLFKEVPTDAWKYYQESDEAVKAKIETFVRDTRGRRRYSLHDFIEVTDKKQAIRLELNNLIERGNNVQRVLELPLPVPPLAAVLAGDENTIAENFRRMQNLQQREQEVETWESTVVEWLSRRLPDRRAEFTRDVGLAPPDTPFSIHRIRVRIERLVRAKESV